MDQAKILSMVDHTLLKQTATWPQIQKLCDEAMKYSTASVCIPPCYISQAADYVQGKLALCTVIGFPNGNTTTGCKVFEAKEAIANGASEIDMVINIGALKEGRLDYVRDEIAALKAACGDKILKVIIETCLLTDEEKVTMCRLVTEAGADFIKTSTGFSTAGATFDDIALFAANVGEGVQMKAAGGISSFADAEQFIALGATRLGTSRLVAIAEKENVAGGTY